jgi:hypothetical protein
VAKEPSERALAQVEAIGHLDFILGGAGLDYWLFGGWAVDFWVGRVTREHDDVDVAAWRRDYDEIRMALVAAGWRHTPTKNEVVGTGYTWQSAEVEFTFVEARDDGSVVIPFPDGEIVWTSEPFGDQRCELQGLLARVIPLDALRTGKQGLRSAPNDAAKDRADVTALSAIRPT